jgi:hypothetical protein
MKLTRGLLSVTAVVAWSCGGGAPGGRPDAPPAAADATSPTTPPTGITLVAPAALAPAIRELAALTPYAALDVEQAPAVPRADRLTFELVVDLDCRECFRIDPVDGDARRWLVHTGDLLGAQYGASAALEHLGFRFRHPFDTLVPTALAFDPTGEPALGVVHAPEVTGQRGLQLHTLHPIEGYWAMWEPGAGDEPARRIFDWIVKNRGNHVQWPALDDIMAPARRGTWTAATTALIEHAHARGLTVGVAAQIFGRSNLQKAFDLSDDTSGNVPFEVELAERLPILTDLPFDVFSLSFGEFFGADPDTFIAAVNLTTAAIHAARPAAAVHASIHVGGDLRVVYNGEDLPYYFLVKFADPSIVSNVHTVMYYDLFEDAGGAYEHDNFFEHRDYLIDQLRDGRPAAYYPESAYWIAFDNSVPLYLPLYVRSRWLDLDGIRAITRAEGLPDLTGHLVFSSGWEWGYWLNDYASLRASYTLPASHGALIADAFGPDLAPAAATVAALAERQADALIDDRLAPYLAGRDALIDAADVAGIHSQPDRVTFAELAWQPWTWMAFEADVLAPLAAFATDLEATRDQIVALGLPDSRWSRELVDGVTVTAARARFILSAYQAVLADARGQSAATTAARGRLDAAYAAGEVAVQRRHTDLHAGPDDRLLDRPTNATIYGYGYLHQADTLCYWRRERAEISTVIDGSTEIPPTCAL